MLRAVPTCMMVGFIMTLGHCAIGSVDVFVVTKCLKKNLMLLVLYCVTWQAGTHGGGASPGEDS